MLRRQKFCPHSSPAASQSRVSTSKIDKARFCISQNKTGAVVSEALRKIEAPFFQSIKCRTRSEPTQREHRRHIKRTAKSLPQAHRPKIVMIIILRIVVGILIADCVSRIRQQTRSGEQPLIDRIEVN